MKKLFLILGLLCLGGVAHADYNVFNSSNIAGNVTNDRLWIGRGTLMGIVVGKGGTTSTMDLYDGASSTTNIRKIASLDTTALRSIEFDVAVSSGLTITTAGGAAANVSIIFKAGQ